MGGRVLERICVRWGGLEMMEGGAGGLDSVGAGVVVVPK